MNVFTMKLENRHSIISNQEKTKDVVGPKKCKNLKKRVLNSSCNKDALINNGLGRKFCENSDLNPPTVDPIKIYCNKRIRSNKECPKTDKMLTESDKIQERLQKFLSTEDKEKIMCILNDVRALSDIQKLYLYLQLPTGSPFDVDPFKQKLQNPLGKKADEEGLFAITWIQSHLEEDPDVSLPKQEVYDEYQSYCTMAGTEPLCAADFGKVMKQIFPSVKPRRLGTRGNSRYCYSGLKKKVELRPPSVPDIQKENKSNLKDSFVDESNAAACHLLLEWAEKLLGVRFGSLKELASHLLENMYVDNRSVAAFTLLLDSQPQLPNKGVTLEGCAKKSEAQFHLHRKIQEKEHIKEQKKKLQEQRSSIINANSRGKGIPSKKKSRKGKRDSGKIFVVSSPKSEGNELFIESAAPNNNYTQAEELMPDEVDIKVEDCISRSASNVTPTSIEIVDNTVLPKLVLSPLSSPNSNTTVELEDYTQTKPKVFISQKTPVCISQSLPSIILVPSVPQITAQSVNAPKYKRIQPKPLLQRSNTYDSVIRSRAGSVGSSLPSKPKNRNMEGRRSSHAWLQSNDNAVDSGEEGLLKSISDCNSGGAVFKTMQENDSTRIIGGPLKDELKFETPHNNLARSFLESITQFSNGATSILQEKRKKSPDDFHLKSHYLQTVNNTSEIVEDNNSIKRHLDERDEHADNKRVHLEPNKLSLSANKTQLINDNKLYTRITHQEVNVHEIEGDALNDYFHGGTGNLGSSLQQSELQHLSSTNKLSQLRMLLEQNLPNALPKGSSSTLRNQKVSKSIDTSENIQTEMLKKSFTPVLQTSSKSLNTDIFFPNKVSNLNAIKIESQVGPLGNLSSNYLTSDTKQIDNGLLMDVFLQNNFQGMNLENDINQNSSTSNALMSSNMLSDIELAAIKHENTLLTSGRINMCTQVPSVPQSPNTRRIAFNFMPISPRHTPIPEGTSPHPRTVASIGVGPSQPPSNSGSPFVSPRSTPVPLCRSRHSSGQSTYSTSRHTPFQNFDSGVSSISSSPFISPQPTPVPVSRLRHNSSHGCNKTVTFSSINSPQVILASNNIRTRHSSGPGAPQAATLSSHGTSFPPLVSDPITSFVFPTGNEVRSRHNSGSNTAMPMSPVSEHASSSSSCASNVNDLGSISDSASQSFLNDGAGDPLISANPSSMKQVRHRHASGSVIYGKSTIAQRDIFSQEIQKLLKNYQENGTSDSLLTNRSQSVPLHQMLQTANAYSFLPQPVEDFSTKSHPSTPVMNQMFSFPPTQEMIAAEREKSALQLSQIEWTTLDGSDMEMNPARRNLTNLYDAPPPMSDDLQTTLEDLRDCDTDFSKLELELRQTDESTL